MTDTNHDDSDHPEGIRITVVVQGRYTLDGPIATGRRIKESAGIPPDYSLHRRAGGGTETIHDDESVEVRNGDHFFAQPRSQPALGHTVDG